MIGFSFLQVKIRSLILNSEPPQILLMWATRLEAGKCLLWTTCRNHKDLLIISINTILLGQKHGWWDRCAANNAGGKRVASQGGLGQNKHRYSTTCLCARIHLLTSKLPYRRTVPNTQLCSWFSGVDLSTRVRSHCWLSYLFWLVRCNTGLAFSVLQIINTLKTQTSDTCLSCPNIVVLVLMGKSKWCPCHAACICMCTGVCY